MEVKLLYSYQNEEAAQLGASYCVGKETPSVIGLEKALASGHYSLIEHLPLTWSVRGVSRALLAQLSRHRHISLSVESQRYVAMDSPEWHVPECFQKDDDLSKTYFGLLNLIKQTYDHFLKEGIKPEDARCILPNCTLTNLILSINARAFVEICKLRLCLRAQKEIRDLFGLLRESIKEIYPSVHELCRPNCSACTEVSGCKFK